MPITSAYDKGSDRCSTLESSTLNTAPNIDIHSQCLPFEVFGVDSYGLLDAISANQNCCIPEVVNAQITFQHGADKISSTHTQPANTGPCISDLGWKAEAKQHPGNSC